MEKTAEMEQNTTGSRKKRGFWGWCAAFIRWAFILLFVVILLGGLYFKAPWKILLLDGLLLALLTVVPKKKRKYGWLTLAAAVLAVTVWIFIPEKDTGNWRPYTFDEELAVLEAERIVSPEDNAAPLYESLFDRWQQIEENDPFPEEADADCVTQSQPWTSEEFPEVAAWFERHNYFFLDLITATQKPACYFPAAVTAWSLSESMERLSPVKHFAQHLIRASYYESGEDKTVFSVYQKQLAALSLGKHINQQPLMIDMLVGIAIEAMAYDVVKTILMQESFAENATLNDIGTIKKTIETCHFDHQAKWQQILAHEKLLAKNTLGMMYEINSEGKIRSAHFKSVMNAIQGLCLDEELAALANSYWKGVSFKISKLFLWFSGYPNDPNVLSGRVDEAYDLLEEAIQSENGISEIDSDIHTPFELNYKYLIKSLAQISLPSFKKIQGDILPRILAQKLGTEIVCDLVLYEKQYDQYPDNLNQLWPLQEGQIAAGQYSGFVYEKAGDSFKLYHVGQNGIDEGGHYQMPDIDLNNITFDKIMDMKPELDDILIWPDELGDDD
ncbi:MAG: hypothetical protein ABFR90_06780 [Planctomycetota bacterium]